MDQAKSSGAYWPWGAAGTQFYLFDNLIYRFPGAGSVFLVRGCFMLIFGYHVIVSIYNLFFHPLATYPGPLLARSTLLWRIFHTLRGRSHRAINTCHKIYGPVFRVSPNELSFASCASWRDIYGHAQSGNEIPIKSEFYDIYGAGFRELCIGSERDPQKHKKMKSSLSAAFSTRALLEQEHIVGSVVDRFVQRIGEDGGPQSGGLNMTKWYEMVAFDVLGEMAFGESFHCVENGKPHFWPELILKHLFFITLADNLQRLALVPTLGRLLFPYTESFRNKHSGFTREKVARRLESKSERKDFVTNLITKIENGEIAQEEMTAHASTLIIAGGETVATFLAATTFYLLKSEGSAAYKRLCEEIRSRYNNYNEINTASAQQLPYLQAVISEGLRIYPPGSQGFPRISPGQFVDGHWVPRGTEIYTSAWTVTHDEAYFPRSMDFMPDRWINNSETVKEASQPFSLGPRGCLGKNFAMMEINHILAKILWKYDLKLVNKDLNWEDRSRIYVMWWKPSLMVEFLPRTADQSPLT